MPINISMHQDNYLSTGRNWKMKIIILNVLLISLNIAEPHCNLLTHSPLLKCKYGLKESPTGIGAGFVRNLTAQCLYDKHSEECQYMFFWRPPEPTGTPVSKYRIKITYQMSKHVCFLVPASQTTFVFNQSMGLLFGCGFDLYVTPLPIAYVDNAFEAHSIQVYGCPVAPVLLPLPNVIAKPGSSYSFVLKFAQEPIPSPNITWYFTDDKVYCKNLTLLRNGPDNVFLSKDRKTIKILNISETHVGCYLAAANNSIGRINRQRGYLDLNISSSLSRLISKRLGYHDFEGPLFGSLAGIMIALIISLLILRLKQKRTPLIVDPEEKLLKCNIYISHCAISKKERNSLIQFAADLKGSGFDVVLDLFNQVEINHAGGMCRWVQKNMAVADKIIIFLNQDYISASKLGDTGGVYDFADEHVRKVQWELNFMDNLSNILSNSKDRIVIVSEMHTGDGDLPCCLRAAQKFKINWLSERKLKPLLEILQK